jgi:hypothetical protein
VEAGRPIGNRSHKKIGKIRRFAIHFTCQEGRNAQNAFRFAQVHGRIDAKVADAAVQLK